MTTAAILVRPRPGHPIDAQRAEALACAARHGFAVRRVYVDGGRSPRRARQAVMREAGERIDILIVPSLSTLGATMPEVLGLLTALRNGNVRLVVAEADDSAVEAFWEALPVLLGVQHALRLEAIQRGREAARQRGVRFGRPPVSEERKARALAALADGLGLRAAARKAGISPASVFRARAEAERRH